MESRFYKAHYDHILTRGMLPHVHKDENNLYPLLQLFTKCRRRGICSQRVLLSSVFIWFPRELMTPRLSL